MGIGSFLELPKSSVSKLREICAAQGIRTRVEIPEGHAAESYPGLYIFCSLLGRIVGRWRTSGNAYVFWLTIPQTHRFVPLIWPFDFYLERRIKRILLGLGAHRIDPQF